MSYATARRGRQVADSNNHRHALELIAQLQAPRAKGRGLLLEANHQQAVREWMRAAFHRGISYGRRLARRAAAQ